MLGRLSALTTIAMMLACGGDPAPLEPKSPQSERKSDDARAERKRKRAEERKRQEQEEADAREAEERKERMRKRDEEAQQESPPQEQRVVQKDEPATSEDADEQERRERKERIRKREEAEAKAAAKKKKAKKNVEEAEADEEVAEEEPKKKNVEEADEASEEAGDEAKATPFKKRQTAAEKKAAARQAAKEKAAEKKAAAKQAAEEKAAAKQAAKEAAAEKKKQAAEEKAAKKKVDEEKVADEAEEEPAEEEAKPVAKADKRKAKAKRDDKVDEADIEVDTASLPPPDPSEESNELDLTAGTPSRDEEVVVAEPKTYAIDRRPLTLGRGKIDVHGGLVATAVTVPNGMGGSTTASAQGLALGATYGIGAKGELGFDYTLSLHPGDLQGPLMFHGAYVAKQTEKLDIALSLGLAIDFIDSTDPMTMMTSTRAAKALQVGIWARYHLGAKLSAFSGLPALPSSAGSLGKTAPLPPIPYQLSIGLSSVDAIALDLPAGLGYQATPKLYTFGALDLAHLGMNNTTSALLFADFIPISLGGFYAASKMDVGAVFSDDLKQGADYLRFDVVVRYSIK